MGNGGEGGVWGGQVEDAAWCSGSVRRAAHWVWREGRMGYVGDIALTMATAGLDRYELHLIPIM